MEYNLQNNEQEPVIIKEKSTSRNSVWYWVLGILILALVGWYGYAAGWFTQNNNNDVMIPVEQNNGIGDGALPINAAPIDSVSIETLESFPVQQVLVVSGNLPDGCTYLETPGQLRDGNVFYITLETRTEGELCTQALVPYTERIPLQVNNLPAGVYIVNVNGREISFELENDNTLDFTAGSDK